MIGRSVRARSVTHGTPSTVVSSWRPPESVSTTAAPSDSDSISMYPSGSVVISRPRLPSRPNSSTFFRVRGCIGKTTGMVSAMGRTSSSTGSNCSITRAICRACVPDPTPS